MRQPLPWYGGKYLLSEWIISFFSAHQTYIEGFGGGGAVLWRKEPSPFEIYNDTNSEIVNFFRVMRDEEKCEKLVRQLEWTPYARDEHACCIHEYGHPADEIERARRFFVLVRQSWSTVVGETWRISTTKNLAADFSSAVSQLTRLRCRLARVGIENRPFQSLAKMDKENVLWYLDPPYPISTRSEGKTERYEHEMTNEQHQELVQTCLSLKGKVILSGYPTPLYEPLAAAGWHLESKRVKCFSARTVRPWRTEMLWLNPQAYQGHLAERHDIFAHDCPAAT